MMNYASRLLLGIYYCRRRPLRLNVTICANVHIHCSYLNIQLISQTVISPYVCCTKTHIKLWLAYSITGLEHFIDIDI